MDRNLPYTLKELALEEGGWSNRSTDKGGPTNLGITLATMRETVAPNATVKDLKALTLAQAQMIYTRYYADPVHFNELPDGLDLSVFDFAVNSGPSKAVKVLQQVLGVVVDGKIGVQTTQAIGSADLVSLITRYDSAREDYLRSIGGPQGISANPGWIPRVERVKEKSLALAKQPKVTEPQVITVPEPVAVKASTTTGPVKVPISIAGAAGVAGPVISGFVGLDYRVGIVIAVIVAIGLGMVFLERRKLSTDTKTLLGK